MLSGITYAVIMVSCIFYGLLFQRGKNIKWMIVSMLGLAALGTLSINIVDRVDSFLLYVSLVLLGLGMSGLLTSSLYLVNTFSTPEHRGYITGLQTLVGILGISVQTFLGAVLMEFTNRNGPFNLFGGICVLFVPLTFYLYSRKKPQNNLKESLIESSEDNLTALAL
jgi:MFS family permease